MRELVHAFKEMDVNHAFKDVNHAFKDVNHAFKDVNHALKDVKMVQTLSLKHCFDQFK